MSRSWEGGGAAPGPRLRRREVRARRRLIAGLVVLVLVAAAGSAVMLTRDEASTVLPPSPSRGGSPSPFSERLVLSVTGGPSAMLAVVGSGGGKDPGALVLPPGVTIVAPGQGEVTVEEVAALPAPSMRVAVSNALGAWVQHYAVTDLSRLGVIVDEMGGLPADLPDVFIAGEDVLGPGEVELTGSQVTALLTAEVEDPSLRWSVVLEALLASAPEIQADDLKATDDAATASSLLQAAKGAFVEIAPVVMVGGSVPVLQQPQFDALVGDMFGTETPVRVLVQNGNGLAGIGEAVAARLLPQGFRVVLSENADSFDVPQTLVIAEGPDNSQAAELARRTLGVGIIEVSQVPSGFTDLTIVVGKDFGG